MSKTKLCIVAAAASLLGATLTARAEPPTRYCRSAVTDDTLRPIPPSLVPVVTRLFHLGAMPEAQIRSSTYFRCSEGDVLVCNGGANLPCGKANTSRDLPGTAAWCGEHPGSDFIPRYITGHDTIYHWRCVAGKPAISGRPFSVDSRGFVSRFWKRVDIVR